MFVACSESIEKTAERIRARKAAGLSEDANDESDPVPYILASHFEEAMRDARRSVSDADLAKYSAFAATLQQQRAQLGTGGTSLSNFKFPQANDGRMEEQINDDDLYS